MAIIDLDSHLRDGWLLDGIYRLPERRGSWTSRCSVIRARSATRALQGEDT
jgi:hypothetical protein